MASAMETPAARAQAFWQEAKKQRSKIIREIESLKKGNSGKTEEEQLSKLESGLAEFRLRFVYTISQDPRFTFEQDAEEVMWKLHTFVNQAYRDLIYGNLKGQQHVVTKRKVEKLYNNYLKTALLFYKGYFQRLEALHGMPQIPRINRLLELQAPAVDESQSATIPADAVEKSFHATLLHLGDISRWRNKARPRPDGLKTAVLFYELANDLKPTHGAAHHQLGILEDDNHLHIVYHLYRARAIETPHPNAAANLEQEFKKLLQPSTPSKRSGPPDPNEAFANWFTKLHARLYKGDDFPPELEEEVLHRLDITLKKPGSLPLILKMVLVNIAAYWVAKSKIEKEWSLKASASCQFILRLNVRWILAISRLLLSELEEFVKTAPPAQDESTKRGTTSDGSQEFSAFTETALPLARIYMAWLYIYRNDIVDYQQHLGSYVFDMYRALAQTLTVVAKEFTGNTMAPSPYLLVEDEVALGMKPFDDPGLPAMCRLQHESDKGTLKIHWEDSGNPKSSSEQEMLSRIFDLMGCGLSLAFDERFPLSINTSTSQELGGAITVSYLEGGKPPMLAQGPVNDLQPTDQDIDQLQGQFRSLGSSQDARPQQHVSGGRNIGGQTAVTQGNSGLDHIRAPSGSGILHENSAVYSNPGANDIGETESDLSLEARIENMVDNLLDDDTPDFGTRAQPDFAGAQRGPPHDINPGIADQIFGSVPRQLHGGAGVFDRASPPFQWDAPANASRSVGGRTSATTTPQQAVSPIHMSRSRTSTFNPSVPAFGPGSRPQSDSEEQLFPAVSGTLFGSPYGQSALRPGGSSSGVSGSARGSFGHSRQRLGGSADSSGASPFLSAKDDVRAYRTAAGSENVDLKGKMPSPPGFEWGNSSFSTAFSQNASGLPAVNSPFGLPGASPERGLGQRDALANYQTYGAQPSNWAQYHQPNNFGTASDGHVFDATTAYGRGDIVTKDDPTHFRNAMKGTAMAAGVQQVDAHDQMTFQSALADDHPKPKR